MKYFSIRLTKNSLLNFSQPSELCYSFLKNEKMRLNWNSLSLFMLLMLVNKILEAVVPVNYFSLNLTYTLDWCQKKRKKNCSWTFLPINKNNRSSFRSLSERIFLANCHCKHGVRSLKLFNFAAAAYRRTKRIRCAIRSVEKLCFILLPH